jgi:CDP-glucose 4,6-dehydratase
MNPDFWQGRRVLLTGHTGFKGSWLSLWLQSLGAEITGYALAPPTNPSLFTIAGVSQGMTSLIEDIRDLPQLQAACAQCRPEIVIHMAAQPLVLESYKNPRETFDVNVMGTVNVLDIAFRKDFIKAIVIVTTDKVYRNDNSGQAFIESDPLEGKDPYSASKVGTEAVVAAWQQISRTN